MKHVLAFLCTAFLPFLTIDEAAASLLLNNNPTPPSIELDPAFVSGEGYQLAKVTWLPDYLGNNKSHGGKRVDDGGKDVGDSNCEKYGYVGSCGDGQTGTEVSVAGLTCYKNCKAVDCKEYGLVSEEDCPPHYVPLSWAKSIGGVMCYDFCSCDDSYYKYTDYNCRQRDRKAGGEKCNASLEYNYLGNYEPDGYGDDWRYTECVCTDEYNLPACPPHGSCTYCGGKYKLKDCESNYIKQGNECVLAENCSAYPLTVCPAGGTCSKCPDNSAKLKLDSCDTSKGWKLSGNTCEAVSCPAGYAAGVTSCTSGSTKPDYSSNGWAGGQQCGVCKCNNATDCSAYTLTSQSDANANYDSCTTGCGSEKVTKYKITSCKSGYELKNGKCEAVSSVCPVGWQNTDCPAGYDIVGADDYIRTADGVDCWKCTRYAYMCFDESGNYHEGQPGKEGARSCCMYVSDDYCEDADTTGSIVYTDGSTCSNIVKNKTPYAYIVDDDYGIAVDIYGDYGGGGEIWSELAPPNPLQITLSCMSLSGGGEICDCTSGGKSRWYEGEGLWGDGLRNTKTALKSFAEIVKTEPDGIFAKVMPYTRRRLKEALCNTTALPTRDIAGGETSSEYYNRLQGMWYIPSYKEIVSAEDSLPAYNCTMKHLEKTHGVYGVIDQDNEYWLSFNGLGGHVCSFRMDQGSSWVGNPVSNDNGYDSQRTLLYFTKYREYIEMAQDKTINLCNPDCSRYTSDPWTTYGPSMPQICASYKFNGNGKIPSLITETCGGTKYVQCAVFNDSTCYNSINDVSIAKEQDPRCAASTTGISCRTVTTGDSNCVYKYSGFTY